MLTHFNSLNAANYFIKEAEFGFDTGFDHVMISMKFIHLNLEAYNEFIGNCIIKKYDLNNIDAEFSDFNYYNPNFLETYRNDQILFYNKISHYSRVAELFSIKNIGKIEIDWYGLDKFSKKCRDLDYDSLNLNFTCFKKDFISDINKIEFVNTTCK